MLEGLESIGNLQNIHSVNLLTVFVVLQVIGQLPHNLAALLVRNMHTTAWARCH